MASTAAQVAHVWRRLGFGPAPGDVAAWTGAGPQALAAALLTVPPTGPADWAWPFTGDWTEVGKYEARLLELMTTSPCQVQERMAFLLMGLLVTAFKENLQYEELKEHIGRLREGALGSYATVLSQVTASTAMQMYLDGVNSTEEHPNENLGRELCELFALGVTHPVTGQPCYTEGDVKEIARALTGYRLDWNVMHVYHDPSGWDAGPKTFLGQSRGAAGLPEVVQAVTTHPSFPYFVARRVYRELVGLQPDAAALEALVAAAGPGVNLLALVQAVAGRPEFLGDPAIGARVKCPIELVVSALRVLQVGDLERFYLGWALTELQQHPFRAPNVNGWPSGSAWLHAGQLIQWSTVAQMLCWSDDGSPGVPVAQQCPTIRTLHASASGAAAGDLALELAGLVDPSVETLQAVRDYAAGGAWTFDRARAVMNLVLVSPEFLVN